MFLKKEDFLKTYSSFSNIDLLKILEEEEKYQPAAVDAAKEILSLRSIKAEEKSVAENEINFIAGKRKLQEEKIKKAKRAAGDFIEENFGLKEKSPYKTLNLFCAFLFVYYLISGISGIKGFSVFFHFKILGYLSGVLLYLLPLLITYLLYRRNKWGWIFATAGYTINAAMALYSFISLLGYKDEFFSVQINPYPNLIPVAINTGILIFLISKKIKLQFPLGKNNQRDTLIISLTLSILLIFFLASYYI